MPAKLLTPIKIRELEISNRVMMSPMCQYSADNGYPNNWHYIHYGSRAVGKIGLIMLEATAVEPKGRITPWDLGIWSDEYVLPLKELTTFMRSQGTVPAIQLAHAGRKAGTSQPWNGSVPLTDEQGGYDIIAPSPIAFAENSRIPHSLTLDEIQNIVKVFKEAAKRALEAGFLIAEIHSAHGYLLHEFLSPITNKREDEYGGSLENRQRLLLEIAQEVRALWPQNLPVFVRISSTDWLEGGWDINDTVDTANKLAQIGIDLIDVSSGGISPDQKMIESAGFQVPFAEAVKNNANILTAAVGMITEPDQANMILEENKADIIALGRELLRNPYWVYQAGKILNTDIQWPNQYLRAK